MRLFIAEKPSVARAWRALADDERSLRKQKSQLDLAEHWSVENGELVNDGQGLYLTTEREFGDFELRFNFGLPNNISSEVIATLLTYISYSQGKEKMI